MIIWINGVYGSGKTTASHELRRRLENSLLYDPEDLGTHLMKNIPINLSEDNFQYYKSWRDMTSSMLLELGTRYNGHIIVPMTLTNKNFRNEIFKTLDNKIEIKEVILTLSEEICAKRLRSRGSGKNSWAFKQFKECSSQIEDLKLNKYCEHEVYFLEVDNETIESTVEKIGELCKIDIKEENRITIKKVIHRYLDKIKDLVKGL